MNPKELTRRSKFIAMVLRHDPGSIGLTLDEKGRLKIHELIEAMNLHDVFINREILNEIVESNDKKRFVIDSEYIYAAQGHSISAVNVEMKECKPPSVLFHGTATSNLNSIYVRGIDSGKRNHVHLSPDIETAIKVGSRHGTPIVLIILAEQMYVDGFKFYLSQNDVWLTRCVPSDYIHSITK